MIKLLRNIIFGLDWKAIILCVSCAATFWFLKAMSNEYSTDVKYPIEYIYNGKNIVPSEGLPGTITLNVTGNGWDLLKKTNGVSLNSLKLYVDNFFGKGYVLGSDLVPVFSQQVEKVKVNFVVRDTFFLPFERLTSKDIALIADENNVSLAEGYGLTDTSFILPSLITISGPASLIKQLSDSLYVGYSGPDKIAEAAEKEIDLSPYFDERINLSHVNVRMGIYPEKLIKKEKVLPVKLLNFPDGVEVDSEKVTLQYYVRQKDLKKDDTKGLKAELDYKKVAFPDSSVSVILPHKPDYIKSYFFTPSQIKVRHVR